MSWTDAAGYAVGALAAVWAAFGGPLPQRFVRWIEEPTEGQDGGPREW